MSECLLSSVFCLLSSISVPATTTTTTTVKNKTVPLSWDHKPNQPGELARIVAAGGCVMNGRVDGDLAVARALGDYQFKRNSTVPDIRQRVSPEPDITVYRRTANSYEFLVVACDGVWDIVSNEACTGFIRRRLPKAEPCAKVSFRARACRSSPSTAGVGRRSQRGHFTLRQCVGSVPLTTTTRFAFLASE